MKINELAKNILQQAPDPVVKFILLSKLLKQNVTYELIEGSIWYRHIKKEQRTDGSWGRFHSQDTSIKQHCITTETTIDRCMALGLDKSNPILERAIIYIQKVLKKEVEIIDLPEKNDRWETGVEMFTGAYLSLIDPQNPLLDKVFEKWLKIAETALSSGDYRYEDDKKAHYQINNIRTELHYLKLYNRYALTILASRAKDIPSRFEKKLANWIWNKDKGIAYFRSIKLDDYDKIPPIYLIDTVFPACRIMEKFPSWKTIGKGLIDYLFAIKDGEKYWDFGKRPSQTIEYPLSESWRKPINRKFDYTTKVLMLLHNFYEG